MFQPPPLPQTRKIRKQHPTFINFSDPTSNATTKITIVCVETASRELLSDVLRPQHEINFISFLALVCDVIILLVQLSSISILLSAHDA